MPLSKYIISIFMTSMWISYSFLFVTISCVHPSLWIYIIMIFIYLESYTLERSYICSWYPYSFTSTFTWWLCERIYLECGSYILLHLDAILCGEDYFPHSYLYEDFAILIGIPRIDKAFFSFFTMGCHKCWLFILHF